jgi:hypothetical protein
MTGRQRVTITPLNEASTITLMADLRAAVAACLVLMLVPETTMNKNDFSP